MLNWDWKNKIGYMVVRNQEEIRKTWHEYKISLYAGNAPFIAISEWKNDEGKDMYSLYTFFCDKEHAKRCLGLEKDCDYLMEDVLEVHLTANMDKDLRKIVELWQVALVKYHAETKIIIEYME